MFPIHINLGFNIFYFYEAIYYIIAIAVGGFIGFRALKKIGFTTEEFTDLLVSVVLGLIIGARLFHFIFWNPAVLLSNPLSFFMVWEGGASVTGGIVFGILAAAIYLKVKGKAFFHTVAVLAPAALIGQAVGRIGCFLNGDAHGIYTSLPWGVRFPKYGRFFPNMEISKGQVSYAYSYSSMNDLPGHTANASAPLHPTQIYEALGDMAIALIIIFVLLKLVQKRGSWAGVFFFYTGSYALLRFALEFIRADRVGPYFLSMSTLQITLLVFGAAAVIYSIINFILKKPASDTISG